jgi:cytochrome c biogenesis protein CcmG, thiol:disulfide interchange protein DsbE
LVVVVVIGVVAAVAIAFAASVPLGPGPGASTIVIGGSPLLNQPAPNFTLPTLDGGTASLSDYRGRPVIVNFWASWCGPCRDEFPQFVEARADHAKDGLEILGLVHDDSVDAAKSFASANGATWPLLNDAQQQAWNAYQIKVGLPTTYFIDRDGIIRAVSLGPVTPTSLPIQLKTIL